MKINFVRFACINFTFELVQNKRTIVNFDISNSLGYNTDHSIHSTFYHRMSLLQKSEFVTSENFYDLTRDVLNSPRSSVRGGGVIPSQSYEISLLENLTFCIFSSQKVPQKSLPEKSIQLCIVMESFE